MYLLFNVNCSRVYFYLLYCVPMCNFVVYCDLREFPECPVYPVTVIVLAHFFFSKLEPFLIFNWGTGWCCATIAGDLYRGRFVSSSWATNESNSRRFSSSERKCSLQKARRSSARQVKWQLRLLWVMPLLWSASLFKSIYNFLKFYCGYQ